MDHCATSATVYSPKESSGPRRARSQLVVRGKDDEARVPYAAIDHTTIARILRSTSLPAWPRWSQGGVGRASAGKIKSGTGTAGPTHPCA